MRLEQPVQKDLRATYMTLILERYEITIASAVVREQVFINAREGNEEIVPTYFRSLAPERMPDEDFRRYNILIEQGAFMGALSAFVERTTKMVEEIPDITRIPPYRNADIHKRVAIGEDAKILREKIANGLGKEIISRTVIPDAPPVFEE